MANRQIVAAWEDNGFAYLAVRVPEGPPIGQVEYIGRLEMTDAFRALPQPQQLAALADAVKTERQRSIRTGRAALPFAGQVDI